MEYTENNSSANQNRVNIFLALHGNKFTTYQLQQVKATLPQLTQEQYQAALALDYKDPTMMLIISLLGGILGIDRFVLNDTVLGIIKLLTCGGLYIWWIVDFFLIQDRAKEHNFELFVLNTNNRF